MYNKYILIIFYKFINSHKFFKEVENKESKLFIHILTNLLSIHPFVLSCFLKPINYKIIWFLKCFKFNVLYWFDGFILSPKLYNRQILLCDNLRFLYIICYIRFWNLILLGIYFSKFNIFIFSNTLRCFFELDF